jgi:hypothetical protein
MKKTEISFNPQYYGYAPATNKQIIGGSTPYIYNYLPHDSQVCITSKSIYNQTHSSIFSPDTIVKSHPASNIIQGSTLNHQENMIKKNCFPSFQHNQITQYVSNYGTNNYGTNNYG